MKAQFYYEWGNESRGFVSTGAYNEKGELRSTGEISKDRIGDLEFHNPYQ